jgi:LysR family transcriptional activator of mexEF-oprN operon
MGHVIDDSDRALSQAGRHRRVVLTVPQFSALPRLLAGSDMIAIVPDYVAQAMAMGSDLRAEAAPIALRERELTMVWRGASHNDPGERWLRSRCCAFLAEASDPEAQARRVA